MRLAERRNEVQGMRRRMIIFACAVLGIATCGSALALHVGVDGLAADHPTSQPSRPIAVSSKIMQGQRITGSMPVYPPEAKKARVQGTVVIEVVIDKEGSVSQERVVSGPEMLQASATDAVRDWTYKPFLLNGEPVEVTTTINVIYSLKK